MVQVKRVRAPEIPLACFVIVLFTLAVVVGLYYLLGGPIPYYVQFSGPVGVAFEGRYALLNDTDVGLPEDAATVRGSYPQTIRLWGPRQGGVVAVSATQGPQNVLSTITVRRAGVICSEAYRWGTETNVVCAEP